MSERQPQLLRKLASTGEGYGKHVGHKALEQKKTDNQSS